VRVAVLCGGESSERDVSRSSGWAVAQALAGRGHDVVLIDPAAEQPILADPVPAGDSVVPVPKEPPAPADPSPAPEASEPPPRPEPVEPLRPAPLPSMGGVADPPVFEPGLP